MNESKKRQFHILLICLINLVILILSLFLTPTGDDWGYCTVPRINEEWVTTSRPFDVLYGTLLGKIPFAFPALNHILVVVAHCISSIALYLIATRIMEIKNKRALLFSIVFAIGSTCCATVLSIDSLNQSWSLCFGVVGIYAYMRFSEKPIVKTVVYLISALLASLCKECGIVFFLFIPLFELQLKGFKSAWKRVLVQYVLGGIVCLFYLHFVTSVKETSGFSIINTIKNTLIHIGFSVLQFDTVSFFGYGNMVLPIVTIVLSLPLLFFVAKTVIQQLVKKDFTVLFLGFLTVLSTFPQNLMSGIQEMNSYPTVFFMVLLLAYLCKDWNKKTLYGVFTPYLAAALIAGGVKYHSMYKHAVQSQEILDRIEQQIGHLSPERIKVFSINIFNEDSYGVFVFSPSGTLGYGHAIKSIYNYNAEVELTYYHNRTDKTTIGSTDSTLIDQPYEEFIETLKEYAREEIENNDFDLCLIMDSDCNVIVVN